MAKSALMPLVIGTRLGPYEIVAPLGVGGMGEVYRARDTRLDRTVAIKVLPSHVAADPDLRQRFEREARAIAALNHPHICTLYDVGEAPNPESAFLNARGAPPPLAGAPRLEDSRVAPAAGASPNPDTIQFLVMEYLEGQTLADRLARQAGSKDPTLPIEEGLRYAIQVADALDKAHRAGIVHRDLKPGNVMLTKTGAKVLDFGLAKVGGGGAGRAVEGIGLSALPTTPPHLTAHGTILGTFQYMAPEQLEGKEADARTDIFAFGATVYEMVTGKKAFEGKSQMSLVGAILEREPASMATLVPATPPLLDRTIKRCLAKDPDRRWQAAGDLAHELEWIAESVAHPETAAAAPAAAPAKARTPAMFRKIATALLVVTALGGLAAGYLYRSPASPAVSRFFVSPPEKGVFVSGGRVGASGIISPDGRRLAFTARDGAGKVLLWVRPIDSLTAQPLAGTDEASFPFWSPDSRSLAYFAQAKLLKIDANGGPSQTVCAAPNFRGGAWSRDGVIVFASGGGTLFRVSSAGGQPVVITRLAAGQVDHRFPSFLPDGRHLLFYVNGSSTEITGIYLASLDSGESTRLLASSSGGIYAPPGYLLFTRQGTLLAQPFNAKTVELTGDPFPIAERVESGVFQGVLAFSASENGVLAYGIGLGSVANLQMVWLDRQGKPIETIGPPGNYRGLDLAPDGRRVAAHRHDGQGGDVWVSESSRGTTSRLTFDASQDNSSPIWSPDGTRIAFGSLRTGKWGLYQKPSDGTGNDELLVQSDSPVAPMSWSPDRRSIVYSVTQLSSDVWLLPLSADRKAGSLLNTPFTESRGQISPDGKWLAYVSDETGRFEVYMRPFPTGAGKWQASTSGGSVPRWRRDGRELFYMEVGPGVDSTLMAVEINPSGSTLERGTPKELFDSGYINLIHVGSFNYHPFAVSADGQRFLIPRPTSSVTRDPASTPIAVIVNWTVGLKR